MWEMSTIPRTGATLEGRDAADGARECVHAAAVQGFRAVAKRAADGEDGYVPDGLGPAGHAARHFAVSGLCVQPSFAGKNEVGTGNCGAKSRGVENQINAGEERCAEKGHHGAANPACGARAVPLRGVAAELGGEDGRIAGERLIK